MKSLPDNRGRELSLYDNRIALIPKAGNYILKKENCVLTNTMNINKILIIFDQVVYIKMIVHMTR
jgi:hypothetical protein